MNAETQWTYKLCIYLTECRENGLKLKCIPYIQISMFMGDIGCYWRYQMSKLHYLCFSRSYPNGTINVVFFCFRCILTSWQASAFSREREFEGIFFMISCTNLVHLDTWSCIILRQCISSFWLSVALQDLKQRSCISTITYTFLSGDTTDRTWNSLQVKNLLPKHR